MLRLTKELHYGWGNFYKATQNEVIKLLFYYRDEVADYINHEQFVVRFHWLEKHYEAHEDFVTIYKDDTKEALQMCS